MCIRDRLPGRHIGAPVRNLIPGRQLAEDDLYQIDERVLFDRKDYKRIAALGWNGFWDEHYPVMSRKTVAQLTQMQAMSNMLYDADAKLCEEQGVPVLLGVTIDSVLMAFSLCRTLAEFTKDLYQIPGEVEAAMKACCDDLIANGIEVCKKSGRKMAFIVLERGSGFYYRNARILAMSALITPTFGSMKKTVDLLQERGLRGNRFVIIGGGPTTAAVRDYAGADAWSLNPNIGVQLCREFMEKS